MFIDDLNELAFKNGMFNHEIDKKVKQELDDSFKYRE